MGRIFVSLAASSSPTMTSCLESHWILRPVRMAMSDSRLITSDRTASSTGAMAGLRDLIESMKF